MWELYRNQVDGTHTKQLWEQFIDHRNIHIVELDDIQFGFRKGRSTTEPIFALRILQEKYREKGKDLHMVFVDLEKAYDSVPGLDLVVVEKERNTGAVCRHNTGQVSEYSDDTTEYFDIEVGLHQGAALSPLLLIIVMDVLASEVAHIHHGGCYLQMTLLCVQSQV